MSELRKTCLSDSFILLSGFVGMAVAFMGVFFFKGLGGIDECVG